MLVNVVITIPIILSFLPIGPAGGLDHHRAAAHRDLRRGHIGIGRAVVVTDRSRMPARWRWNFARSVSAANGPGSRPRQAFPGTCHISADYQRRYGSLGAIAAAMMWAYISTLILLVGAEFNAELEQQTECDTTIPPAREMGERGAAVADTLGETRG